MAHCHSKAAQTQLAVVGNVRTDFVLNSSCLRGETNMQRRVGVLFATTVLIFFVLAACRTRTAPEEDDKQAAINVALAMVTVMRGHEKITKEVTLEEMR
jgi:hypothetical protein